MRTRIVLLVLTLLAPLLVVAPARASFPGDNGLLAYISFENSPPDLVTVDVETFEKETVLENLFSISTIAWGPDGRLAATMQPSEAEPAGLYSVDHETGEIELLTTAVTGQFSWSPDGDEVVTNIPAADGYPHVAIVDVTSGGVTDLGAVGGAPSWSPDGSWIAYTDSQPGSEKSDVWLIRPDGTEAHNLTDTAADDEEGMIDWSPDGTEIMIGVTVDPDFKPIRPAHQLHRIDISTGARRQVTFFEQNHAYPAWSPDGKSVAYQARDWWGFGDIQRGLYLGTAEGAPERSVLSEDWVGGVAWQTEPGCLLEPAGARTTYAAGASEPEVKVGSWVAQGCFTKKGSVFKTKDEMYLSGVTLKPTKGSISIDKDTGRLTSTNEVTVSIEGRIEGVKLGSIKLDEGMLAWNLKDPLRFKLQHFLDLPVEDSVLVVPKGDGKSELAIGFVFPQLYGLGVVSQVVKLRNGIGMEETIRYQVPKPIHVTDLIELNDVVIEYNPATKDWATQAKVAGLGTSADIDFKHEKGELVRAHLGVPSVNLAGLIGLNNVRFEFDRARSEKKEKTESYTVAADTDVEGGTDSLTGSATYVDDVLDSFNVRLALAHVFGVVKVKGFNLGWSAEHGWNGGGAAVLKNQEQTLGASMSLQLRSKKHKLVGGSLTAPLILLGAPEYASFQLEQVHLAYSDDVLPDGKREETWSGGAKVRLPGPDAPAVGGSFTFVNGAFTAGSIEANNVGLGPAFKLKAIGGAIGLTPLSLDGTAQVQLGPEIPVLGAATIGGTASYRAAAKPTLADTYTFGGSLDVGNANLIGANVTYLTSGVTTADGTVSWKIGDLSLADGQVNGYFDKKTFFLGGSASVGIGTTNLAGSSKMNQQGVAGCVTLPNTNLKFGFGYLWSGEKRRFQGVCDMDKFLAPPAARPRLSGTAAAMEMPAGLDGVVIEVRGDGGPPIVTFEGPNGTSVTVPASGEDGFVGDAFVFTDDESDATYVVIPSPAAGTWSIDESPGSVPITGVRTAEPLPELAITGTVSPAGDGYELTYSAAGIGGQDVLFVERWADGEAPIGELDSPSGTIEFEPSPGPAGERKIVAIVTQDGLVRDEVEVATFETAEIAPACTTDVPCASTTSLKLKHKGKGVVLTGAVKSQDAAGSVHLLVERKRGKSWIEVSSVTKSLSATGKYKGSLKTKGNGNCRATATYLGTPLHQPSSVTKTFSCAPSANRSTLKMLLL